MTKLEKPRCPGCNLSGLLLCLTSPGRLSPARFEVAFMKPQTQHASHIWGPNLDQPYIPSSSSSSSSSSRLQDSQLTIINASGGPFSLDHLESSSGQTL
ncbi:hypothetical protein E2C01_002333 [Portunus trituberculatus]|uniref:Uncharacterized protein n=1 Tax=Portunus trituberculatus TaxID=210409 RepID=A0A5B7CM08_PORTR|nr:hypothetical protein [Portunus trituberculatus]